MKNIELIQYKNIWPILKDSKIRNKIGRSFRKTVGIEIFDYLENWIKNRVVDSSNYHLGTIANWKKYEGEIPTMSKWREVGIKQYYSSESGSQYYVYADSVIRTSNHWKHKVKSCCWLLEGEVYEPAKNHDLIGYCKFTDMSLDFRNCFSTNLL
jgi:hypothetical protein